MKTILKSLGLVALSAVAAPVLAQDTGTEAGTVYIAETNRDWQVRCMTVNEGTEPCQMYQLILDANGNPVAEISVFPLPAGNEAVAGATFVAPLGTLLPEGVGIMVDDGSPRVYAFEHCNPDGCVARMGFTQAELDQFKAGNAAKIRLISVSLQEPIILPMSLSGFTASFAKATVLEN